jgi:DNA-binding PadR family transcriptional regulator
VVPVNATSAVILGLLHDGAATGGDLVAAAERRLAAQGGVTRSQVYRELPQLVRDGYVDAEVCGPGKRTSQAYVITPAGRTAFAAWALAPAPADSVRSAAVLRLGFGAHLKTAQRRKIIAAAVAEHEFALAEHEQCAKDLRGEGDAFAASAAEFAVMYERAVVAWLRTYPA